MATKKLYCYVDENGQDSEGRIFIVSVVVTGKERNELLHLCERLEKESGKGKFKWGKAQHKLRLEYLRRVFTDRRFKEVLRYSVSRIIHDYDLATIMGIVKAVNWKKPTQSYTALIYVDGLGKTKRRKYGSELRKLGVRTRKVQGVAKDENNPLTRLADAIAGFVRDVEDGEKGEARKLFEKAIKSDALVEV